jgi:hypothetical protein
MVVLKQRKQQVVDGFPVTQRKLVAIVRYAALGTELV